MADSSQLAGNRQAEEIAWVTLHFHDLQGIQLLPGVAAIFAVGEWVRVHGASLADFWFIPAVLLIGFLGAAAIHPWYRKRFGYIQPPDPPLLPSPVLSILQPAPTTPRQRVRGPEQRLSNWIILSMWLAMSIMDRFRGQQAVLDLLMVIPLSLLPRCFSRAPNRAILQLRRAMSIAATLLLLYLIVATAWLAVSKWLLVYCIFACFVVLVAYDHWLLLHLLGRRSFRESQYAD